MPLKTLVKVGQISNLSDARYCAGMGVDFLGFSVNPANPSYVSPELFQEFRGWFTGPVVVAELEGIQNIEVIQKAMTEYSPDFLETDLQNLPLCLTYDKPIILSVTPDAFSGNFQAIKKQSDRIQYILTSGSTEELASMNSHFPVLLSITEKSNLSPDDVLELPVQGIALTGSSEDKPGLKDYDHLALFLEALETED